MNVSNRILIAGGFMKQFTVGIIKIVLVSLLLLISGCREHLEFNEKLIVTVDTPEGEKSGSSVTKFIAEVGRQLMSGNDIALDFSGEATVVDLGSGRYLFALLDKAEYRAEQTWYLKEYSVGDKERSNTYHAITASRERRKLVGPLPTLVTFKDLNNPESVVVVDPDDLAATFGKGYALKSVEIEITDEKVTDGKVLLLLPWLIEVGRSRGQLIASTEVLRPLRDLTPEELIAPYNFLSFGHWKTK